MASDVENLTTFYANLPSIFETDPLTSIESSSNSTITINDNEKTYQPIFGSFLFADSEPFTRAAFVASTSSSIEVKPPEEQTDATSALKENNIQTIESSPLAPMEDLSDIDVNDDEDDFDGIPIRHATSMIKEILNGNNHSEQNNLLDKFVHHIENDNDNDGDDDIDLLLNGFTDEQEHVKTTIPSLFNNIPDIDDLNEHEEDNDDRIPFDHMDMLDESDSIRSSSPDSVLSSSHLRDDDDDDVDEEEMNNNDDKDDVTQWNDDYLLGKIILQNDRPNAPLPPSIVLNIHPHDQVDFIDTSRSHSRCSDGSSNLSIGYGDQGKIFLNDDDELVTSSDSESDHDDDVDADKINFENDLLTRDHSEEPSLQVNLDYHRSRSSSYSENNSTHSLSPLPISDQSPIITIDDHINEIEKTNIQSAPIAIVDDDDDDNDNLLLFTSDQPVLSPIPLKNFIQLRNENRQNEIVHEIINIRHILNENDNDDEFLAIMHNPTVFEDVLYDNDDQQKSDLVKQTNGVRNPFQASSQLSIDNKIESKVFEYCQNIQQTSLLSISNNEKNSPSNVTTTTNNSSPTAVNHLIEEEEEQEENVDGVNRSRIKLKKTQQSEDKNTTNINKEQITNSEQEQQDHYQMMSSDDESDNDSELLETLAQLHGLIHPPQFSSEINQIKEKSDHLISNSNFDEKPNLIFFNNDQNKTYEEKKPSTFLSLTSLTSSTLFNDDQSHLKDMMFDSDASSSLIRSNYDLNNSIISSNHVTNEDLQINNESLNFSSFDIDVRPIIENLVSNTLRLALNEINESNRQIEQFVEQIISDAIDEISHENEHFSTENLALIINWHNQTNKQIFDPYDQKFHSIWISHFQTPDENNIHSTSSFYSNPFDSSNNSLITSLTNINTNNNSDWILLMNESSITPDEQITQQSKDFPSIENQDEIETSSIIERNKNESKTSENFFEHQPRLSQFDSFASDQPLNTDGLQSIPTESNNQSLEIQKSVDDNNEPWELEDNNEEKLKPIPTIITQKHDSYNHLFSDINISPSTPNEQSSDDENNDQIDNENYDNYFPTNQSNENTEIIEMPSSKTVRFSENIQNVAVITPKDSINQSESSTTTSDSDEATDDEPIINNHINEKQTNEVTMRSVIPRPESNISLTESEDLPPPLPPLPPLNNKPTTGNDNIPLKSSPASNIDLKRKINLRSQAENTPNIQTTTDTRLYNNTDSQFLRSNDSAILRSISKDDSNVEPDEVNDVISCMIDNNQVNIDAKTISPFKCIIGSAGQLEEDNQTAVITIYGCWLPDHRLREYRYIMDQLFYYVYHKLEKLVINDYILVYFHGATPKHRTPDLKFLRKCYQMINFRLRKNLRAVYVVHPTRWLRTVIALSRPFFSNKFYHKVHYLFTIAELERQFPQNHISVPIIIEQTDWLYSQKYDRQNASIKRSIERSATRPISGIEDESPA